MACSGPWFRVHRSKYEAIYFPRKGVNRFDDCNQEYGVLYCANDFSGAVIETLGWSTGEKHITRKKLSEYKLARVRSSRPVQLVDLTGEGLAHIGADAELCVGRDRGLSQRWSRKLWSHPQQPKGIAYVSRHDPQRTCCALFDSVEADLNVEELGPLDGPELIHELGKIFDHYRFALIN